MNQAKPNFNGAQAKPIDLQEPWHPKPPALTPRVTTEDFSKGPVKPPPPEWDIWGPISGAMRSAARGAEEDRVKMIHELHRRYPSAGYLKPSVRLTRKSPTTRTDAFIRGFVPAAIGCLFGFIIGMWVAVAVLG